MRTQKLLLAAALTLPSTSAFAQGAWGNVKSWTGTVTIEATDTIRGPRGSGTMTYKATGPFTIADDMMDAGNHMMWPQPGMDAISDPAKTKAATETWKARVIATYAFTATDEPGKPISIACTADSEVQGRVGVISSGSDAYTFQVMAPDAAFKCTGGEDMLKPNVGSVRASALSVTGTHGNPRQVTNTKTLKVGSTNIKVTFTMAPTK